MPEAPTTRLSLLLRLRDHRDQSAWVQFVEVYAPLVYRYLRKRGLQDADAADVTQVCLRQVAAHVGRLDYDRRRGTFRGWLFTIVQRRLQDFWARPHWLYQGSGDHRVQQLLESRPAPEEDEESWDRAYCQNLFDWAIRIVRPQVHEATWQAFWQAAVLGKPARQIAQDLGLSVAAVYVAKSRVMSRLRTAIRTLQENE